MASDTQCTTFHRCVCIWMFIFYLYFDCKPLASYSMSICLVNVSGKKDQMKRGWPKWKTTEKERSRWFWCQPTNSHASFSKWDFYHAIEIEIFQRWPFYQWPAHFTHVTLIMNDMKWPNRIKHSLSLSLCVFPTHSLSASPSLWPSKMVIHLKWARISNENDASLVILRRTGKRNKRKKHKQNSLPYTFHSIYKFTHFDRPTTYQPIDKCT